jgi:hypothetical protein
VRSSTSGVRDDRGSETIALVSTGGGIDCLCFLHFDSPTGEITDFMPVGEIRHAHAILPRLTCARGRMAFQVRCVPRFDYA